MAGDEYETTRSTGKLKLKGVSDGRIDKKKKKKKPKPDTTEAMTEPSSTTTKDEVFVDRSIVLKSLEDEDKQITQDNDSSPPKTENNTSKPEIKKDDIQQMRTYIKTASELRHEEQRRKRLEERLKREGVKTHKQRVEELNRYLSGLSEHHDMPKIGPG